MFSFIPLSLSLITIQIQLRAVGKFSFFYAARIAIVWLNQQGHSRIAGEEHIHSSNHKPYFSTKLEYRLITPSKKQMRKIRKVILDILYYMCDP